MLRQEQDRTWLRVVMREGRKRQIRRVAALLGHPAQRLVRVSIGPLRLGGLRPGEWRHLTPEEVTALRTVAGVEDVKQPEVPRHGPADRARDGQAGPPRKPGRAGVGRRKSTREGGRS